jgi:hypothetical protein
MFCELVHCSSATAIDRIDVVLETEKPLDQHKVTRYCCDMDGSPRLHLHWIVRKGHPKVRVRNPHTSAKLKGKHQISTLE